MSILEDQSLGRKRDKHLIDMAGAERFVYGALRFFYHFLDSELIVTALKSRNHKQQRPLPISCASPSACEKICIKFLFDLRSRN